MNVACKEERLKLAEIPDSSCFLLAFSSHKWRETYLALEFQLESKGFLACYLTVDLNFAQYTICASVCMCLCACILVFMQVYLCVHTHMFVCMWRPAVNLRFYSSGVVNLVLLRQNLSMAWHLPIQLSNQANNTPEMFMPLPP